MSVQPNLARCQERCCSPKYIFTDLEAADRHAAKQSIVAGKIIKSYFCKYCLHIHVTGQQNTYIPWQRKH